MATLEIRRATALLLISAALADGIIHPREEKIIRLGLGSDVYHAALSEYHAADEEKKEEMKAEIAVQLKDKAAKEKALSLLKRIFIADGQYDPSEGSWMRDVWQQLNQ